MYALNLTYRPRNLYFGFVAVSYGKKVRGTDLKDMLSQCGRARSRVLAGANPAPEGLASHRVASSWTQGGNLLWLSVGQQDGRP